MISLLDWGQLLVHSREQLILSLVAVWRENKFLHRRLLDLFGSFDRFLWENLIYGQFEHILDHSWQ